MQNVPICSNFNTRQAHIKKDENLYKSGDNRMTAKQALTNIEYNRI